MTKTVRVTLSDPEYLELKALADRERRTVGAQAGQIIHENLPALKMRRAGETPGVPSDETHPLDPVPSPAGQERK